MDTCVVNMWRYYFLLWVQHGDACYIQGQVIRAKVWYVCNCVKKSRVVLVYYFIPFLAI